MRNFITIVDEGRQLINEATYDKELDKIVAKVLRGSAGHSKGKMIDRDAVLNKGFNMALALDDDKSDNIFSKIKNFVVTDDFLERQYFGKIAKRLGLKGMFMNNGRYITTDVDEFDRYELGRGDNDDAIKQNGKGLLPGAVAKKFKIDLKFKGAADDKMDKDSKPDKEFRIQSNGKRANFNIDRTAPYVDQNKDGKKVRTYGDVDQLKKMFGDDAEIGNAPSGPVKSDSDAGKQIDGITITDDNAMKYIRRYNELMKKAQKDEVMYANINFKSVFGDLYKQLNEEKLSADEEKELQDIVDAMQKALKDGNLYTDALKRDMQEIVDNWKYDKEIAIAAEKEKAKKSFDAAADAAKKKAGDVASKTDAGKDAEKLKLPPGYRIEKIIDKKTLKPVIMIYKGDTLIGQYNVQDDDKDEDIRKSVIKIAQMDADASSSKVASDTDAGKDAEGGFPGDPAIYGLDDDGSVPGSKKASRGALEKFSKSGKGGLANDTDEVDAIKELQQRLKEMGIDITVDGKYGKGTVDAVKRVQEMLGAKQDGDAGPNTIGAIMKMGNIPGIVTFYDDLKRMAELSKKVKKESNEFRYMMTMLEGGNLLEQLSASEQEEYNGLLSKHKAKFDDPEFQMALPKSVKDLISQVIKQDPKGVASISDAGKEAEAGSPKGRFIPVPQDIADYLGLPPKIFYIDTLMDKSESDFYILKDPVSKEDRVRSISGAAKVYVRNIQTMAKVTEPEGQMIKDYLDKQGIPYGNKEVVGGFPESNKEDLSTPLDDADPKDLRGTDVKPGDAEKGGEQDTTDDKGTVDKGTVDKGEDGEKSDTDANKGAEATGTAKTQADKLYQAMKGGISLGTDEDAIFEVFEQITTKAQYDAVKKTYRGVYDRDLYGDLEDELSPNEEYEKDGKVIGTAKTLVFNKIQNLASAKGDGSTVGTPKASADTTDTSQKVDQPMGSAAASEKKTQTIQMGGADWPRISKELGFASVEEFVAYQQKHGTPDMKDAINDPKDYYNKPFEFMPNKAVATKTDAGQSADANTSQSANANAGGVSATANVKPVEPRPTSQGGRNRRQDRWDKLYGATHNPDGSPKNESKEYDMTKKVNEAASMNISMSGDNSAEVAELVGLLRNAGMEKPEPMSMPTHSDGHDDMVSKIRMMDVPDSGGSPCGEDMDEEWDNSPDEEYRDDDYMTRDIAGGLNRPKPQGSLRAKDPAIHQTDESSIREQLWKALNEKFAAEGSRGKKKKSRGAMEDIETNEGSRGKKKKSRGTMEDIKTVEGSRGKSRGKKSRG